MLVREVQLLWTMQRQPAYSKQKVDHRVEANMGRGFCQSVAQAATVQVGGKTRLPGHSLLEPTGPDADQHMAQACTNEHASLFDFVVNIHIYLTPMSSACAASRPNIKPSLSH